MPCIENQLNFEKISAKLRNSGIPSVAGLELTYRCNVRCRHCYVNGLGGEELTLTEYRRLIDDLYDLGTFCLVFTGGEPLLRDDFFDIAGHARKKEFLMVLFTNGTRIDEKTSDRIAAARFWQVEISLCGATADTHDRVTGCPGSFEKTVEAVRHLRKRRITVNLKTLLTRLNVHEYRAMATLARSLDAWFRFDVQVNPRLDGNLEPLGLALPARDIADVMTAPAAGARFDCGQWPVENTLLCNAGKSMLCISPSGDVKPCVIFPVACGNIRQRNVKDIWKSGSGMLGELRSLTEDDILECAGCEDRAFCNRCHANSYLQTGNLRNPTPSSCRIARMRHELIAKRNTANG